MSAEEQRSSHTIPKTKKRLTQNCIGASFKNFSCPFCGSNVPISNTLIHMSPRWASKLSSGRSWNWLSVHYFFLFVLTFVLCPLWWRIGNRVNIFCRTYDLHTQESRWRSYRPNQTLRKRFASSILTLARSFEYRLVDRNMVQSNHRAGSKSRSCRTNYKGH